MGLLAGFKEISFFPTVPTLINAVLKHPKAGELNLDRKIKSLNSGAAPMPLELIEQVKDLGISYSEGWGMSETTSLGVSNPVLGQRKAGSIGIPWPDTDVRLVDVVDGREDVPRGEPGEILIRSPSDHAGLLEQPGGNPGQLKDGWLHTGDIAVWDEDDYLYIVDRKKDMIIAGGFNIYPREIDEVLFQHPQDPGSRLRGPGGRIPRGNGQGLCGSEGRGNRHSRRDHRFLQRTPGHLQSAQAGGIPGDPAQVGGGEDPAEGTAGGGRSNNKIRNSKSEIRNKFK